MIQLPPYDREGIEQQPVYDYNVSLTDVEFRIVIMYRGERTNRWYMTIYDADDNVLLTGRKLSTDVLLLVDLEIDGLPAGDFLLLDTTGAGDECGWDDLGIRHVLLYLDPDDIADDSTSYDITIEAVP